MPVRAPRIRLRDAQGFGGKLGALTPRVTGPLESRLRAAGSNPAAIRRALQRIPLNPRGVGAAARRIANAELVKLRRQHDATMKRRVKAETGRAPKLKVGALADVRRAAAREAGTEATRMARQYIASVRREIRALKEPTVPKIRAILRERKRVLRSRLRQIARLAALKAYGDYSRLRMQELGYNRYTWRTMGDSRVRPSHRRNEGRAFTWGRPPRTGPPGAEPNCRCFAEAA